jgi:DNA-binding response OmpR family regulator
MAERGAESSGEDLATRVVDAAVPREKPRRILVVDDDHEVADGLAEILREYGHEVFVAHDAAEALERISVLEPDAAIIDIGLAGVSGYELAKRARERRGSESIRLIAFTGHSGAAERRLSKEAGFYVHLVKPANIDALLEAVGADSS